MWPSVLSAFPRWTDKFEGRVSFMYCDILGLVTTGRGNLIDPVCMAQGLGWQHSDGTPASEWEVANAWLTVKNRPDLKMHGGMAYAPLTVLRLTDENIDKLTIAKLLQNEQVLLKRFPQWESFPAAAQLGILSVAWACGAMFHFPHFEADIAAQDWVKASVDCHMADAGNPGLVPRNAANVALFLQASASTDPSVLTV